MLYALAALFGLAFVACIAFGDEVVTDDAPPELLDLDEDEGLEKPPEKDAPEDPPAKPDKPEDDGKKPDKTSNWSKRMAEWEKHIPDEEKQSFRNSVDQGGRWGRGEGSEELDALKGSFGKIEAVAANIAKHFNIPEGMSPVEVLEKFADWTPQELAEEFGIKAPGAPEPEPDTPEAKAHKELVDRIAKLEADKEQAKKDAAFAEEQRAFHAEFDPAVKKSVDAFGVKDDDKEPVTSAFEKLAGNLYERAFYSASDPKTVKVEDAIKEANTILDTLLDARQSKRPQRPQGKVTVDPEAKDRKSDDKMFKDRMNDWSDDFDNDPEQQGGPERV